MGAIIIHGGAVLTPDGLRRNWGVRVEGSRIDAVAANGELPVSPEDEVLEAPEGLRGFVLPTLARLPLGWGKASDGVMKNHYPKGLRR